MSESENIKKETNIKENFHFHSVWRDLSIGNSAFFFKKICSF